MSAPTCSSCGASNADGLVYCASCGALMEKSSPAASTGSNAAALAKRRSIRVEADRPPAPGLFSRIKALVIYLFWVAFGVVVVLASMEPKANELREQRVSDPKGILQRVFAASRFTPSGLPQSVINSLLEEQGAYSPESSVRLIPMPVWDHVRVELLQGTVTLHATMSILGRPFHLSETFRLQGGPGSWGLQAESASIGLLDISGYLMPVVTRLIRPAIFSNYKDLEALSTARTLAIRPGLIEFTSR